MKERLFAGQAAIVTGAGSGIGRATAQLLAGLGCAVLVNDPAEGRAEGVAAEIRAAGGAAEAETSAVGGHETARAIVAAAREAFGRVDILVNNAAISRSGAFGVISDADVDLALTVNLLGPFALMRAVWPLMAEQGYGRIVNTSSNAALGTGISGPYAAAKAGLIGLTKDAALSGAPLGIRVNALMPSASTPLLENHPDPAFRAWMARHMPVERIPPVTAYLASREVALNGEILSAAGGRVSRITFLESRGILDPDLTLNTVARRIEEICDLTDASPRVFQRDQMADLTDIFPGYPL